MRVDRHRYAWKISTVMGDGYTVLDDDQENEMTDIVPVDLRHSEEFYSLMQSYRHEPIGAGECVKRFDAVIEFIESQLRAAQVNILREAAGEIGDWPGAILNLKADELEKP